MKHTLHFRIRAIHNGSDKHYVIFPQGHEEETIHLTYDYGKHDLWDIHDIMFVRQVIENILHQNIDERYGLENSICRIMESMLICFREYANKFAHGRTFMSIHDTESDFTIEIHGGDKITKAKDGIFSNIGKRVVLKERNIKLVEVVNHTKHWSLCRTIVIEGD